eukprot:CAMPEP_0114049282 /NCGR_PEP_ID=MMETSP1339-20121228/55881_1 /TAXON_ID=94617 /ORGANISM="Fibrocapsa japonica" /LENGTH=41 /assembly_acc=CAM_ASM_000762
MDLTAQAEDLACNPTNPPQGTIDEGREEKKGSNKNVPCTSK